MRGKLGREGGGRKVKVKMKMYVKCEYFTSSNFDISGRDTVPLLPKVR